MRTKEEFEFSMDQLLEEAVKSFKSTRQYALLQEKMEQMEQDCEAMFQTDEKAFAFECFDFIRSADGQEESHVYRQACRDCVLVLKWMGVLA